MHAYQSGRRQRLPQCLRLTSAYALVKQTVKQVFPLRAGVLPTWQVNNFPHNGATLVDSIRRGSLSSHPALYGGKDLFLMRTANGGLWL